MPPIVQLAGSGKRDQQDCRSPHPGSSASVPAANGEQPTRFMYEYLRDFTRAPADQTRPDALFVPFYNPSMQPSSDPSFPSLPLLHAGCTRTMSIVLKAGALLGPTPHDATLIGYPPATSFAFAMCAPKVSTATTLPLIGWPPATACAFPPRYCRVAQSTALFPRAARMPARMLIGQLGGQLGSSYSSGDFHPWLVRSNCLHGS